MMTQFTEKGPAPDAFSYASPIPDFVICYKRVSPAYYRIFL
jgi:hypothetical protein